jgi:hypothetical protein
VWFQLKSQAFFIFPSVKKKGRPKGRPLLDKIFAVCITAAIFITILVVVTAAIQAAEISFPQPSADEQSRRRRRRRKAHSPKNQPPYFVVFLAPLFTHHFHPHPS